MAWLYQSLKTYMYICIYIWKIMKLLLAFFVAISCFFFFYNASGELLIKALPGQPAANVDFKQYSGFIVTQPQHGRALFYYFVELDSAHDPRLHPLTLRFNGGKSLMFSSQSVLISFCSRINFCLFCTFRPRLFISWLWRFHGTWSKMESWSRMNILGIWVISLVFIQ